MLKSYRSTTLVTSQSGGKFSKVPKKKKKNQYTIFNIYIYIFIVVPCGCTCPKILFYLPKKEVRSVCNLYTIFNIFFIVVPCGCTYPKYCFTYPRKRFEVHATCIPSSIFFYCDSMWVHHPKILFYLPKKEVRSGCTQSLIRFYFKK